MLPRCEFRPLDFDVNRSLLLSWCLRAKQGHTDAQPKRAGCPSGAGVRISWWASQPCSIRLGTAEPEDLPARRLDVPPEGSPRWWKPGCRRAGGTRGIAALVEAGVPPRRWNPGCRRHERGQQTQTTDMANRHSQQARPNDRKGPPPRARTRGTDNRHCQHAQTTVTAERWKGTAPTRAANRHR